MLGKEENWLQKHKGFVFGFAVVVLLLNVVLAMLLPSQKAVAFDGSAAEYAVQDETLAVSHAVSLEGTLTARSFRPTLFDGTLRIDGAAWTLTGEHDSEGWHIRITPAQPDGALQVTEVQADRDWSTVVLLLGESGEEDAADTHFISLHAGSRAAALRNIQSYDMGKTHK